MLEEHLETRETLRALRGKDFLTLRDYRPEQIVALLEMSSMLKRLHKEGIKHTLLEGKQLGMLFRKASTRTRISFEVAINRLGGQAIVLSDEEMQLGRGETVADTAQVLGRYLDGLMIRTFAHEEVETFAKYMNIPVINGLTDKYHPSQVLADLLTIRERFRQLEGMRLTYIGDGNNVANSLLIGGVKTGMDVVVCTPPQYAVEAEIVEYAKRVATETGGSVTVSHEPMEAAQGAHVLYTDVWVSMGQEEEKELREQQFAGFQINAAIQAAAHKDVIVMHCLPAHRGMEITSDVMDGSHSVVFEQAENRLHAQKALLAVLMR